MTINQWSLIVCVVGLTYLSGYAVQYLDGVLAVAAATAVSSAAIYIITRLSSSKILACIATIELLSIGINGTSWYQSHYNGFIYSRHEAIIESMALVQAALLILGGLYYGAIGTVERIRLGNLLRSSIYSRCQLDNQSIKAEIL